MTRVDGGPRRCLGKVGRIGLDLLSLGDGGNGSPPPQCFPECPLGRTELGPFHSGGHWVHRGNADQRNVIISRLLYLRRGSLDRLGGESIHFN